MNTDKQRVELVHESRRYAELNRYSAANATVMPAVLFDRRAGISLRLGRSLVCMSTLDAERLIDDMNSALEAAEEAV